jgi:hypothetical protein
MARAIYSNDPNVGIKAMGYGSFIPNPVSSITYHQDKTDAINRRRSAMSPNQWSVSLGTNHHSERADPQKMTPEQKSSYMARTGDSTSTPSSLYHNPSPAPTQSKVPASSIVDGTVNKYLDAQAKAAAAIVDPSKRALSWNGANLISWLSAQPKPSKGPGLNFWNNAGATDLPSLRYGTNIA